MKKLAPLLNLIIILNLILFQVNKVFSVNNPSGFDALVYSNTRIDLSWNLNSNSDSIILAYNTSNVFGVPIDGLSYNLANSIIGGGIIIHKGNNLTFNHTGLIPNTTYYYKIWSFSGGNIYSLGIIDSSKTLCSPILQPLDEGFENSGNIPACWTQEKITGNLNWVFTNGNPNTPKLPAQAFEGGLCAFLGSNSTLNNGNKTKLISPPIDFTIGTGVAQFGFWACIPSSDILKVYYKTSYNGTWTLLTTVDSYNGNWKHYLLTLPNPSADYYIAFEGTRSNISKEGISIDGVSASRDLGCILPTASSITGPQSLCMGFGGSWSVAAVSGNTYYWSISDGATTTSNLGSNSFSTTVIAGNTLLDLCVTPKNTCGYGQTICMDVCNDANGPQLRTITGNATPCVGSTQTYQINIPVSPPYTIFWMAPSGWSINSGNGTSSINVTVGNTSGQISIIISGSMCAPPPCSNGTAFFNVNPITAPAQPSVISGQTTPCLNTVQTYIVTNVIGVNYAWSVPLGWTITNGQGTNYITVTAGNTSGNITVTPSNTCGNGTAINLVVSPNILPDQPSAITGNISTCSGSSQIYQVSNVSGITYNWTLPSGWNQTSGGISSTITVTTHTGNGNITVTPSNVCGNGSPSILNVTTHSSDSAKINISFSPAGTICTGTTVNFTSSVINEGTLPSYTWLLNGTIVGTNNNTYSSNTFFNDDKIKCILNSNSFCTVSATDTSNIINMQVDNGFNLSENITICENETYNWHGQSITSTGTYYDNQQTINGCDSIYTLNLAENLTYNFIENIAICFGDTLFWHGNNYTTNGVFQTYYNTNLLCDSTYTLNLTINNLPNVTISSIDSIYCIYNSPVNMTGTPSGGTFSGAGVIGNLFNPSIAGLDTSEIYYSYTDINGCNNSDTVKVFVDICDNISNIISENDFIIYPNPANDIINIEFSTLPLKEIQLIIESITGQQIIEFSNINKVKQSLNIGKLQPGIYLIKIKSDNLKIVKFIKS